MDTAEEGGKHRAYEKYVEDIVLGLLKEVAVDERGSNPHDEQIHSKGCVGVDGQHVSRADTEHHRCMDERIERIHAQQAGGDDGVVDNGLKYNGRPTNGESCD